MEWLKIFTLLMGFGLLLGAVILVSVDVYRESERHRLLTRAPRYLPHRGGAPPRA